MVGALPAKSAGTFRLTQENWYEVLGDQPASALWDIGGKSASKLAGLGITTGRQLAAAEVAPVAARFGPTTGHGSS